jgi:predicted PurR-regulated permease PerM
MAGVLTRALAGGKRFVAPAGAARRLFAPPHWAKPAWAAAARPGTRHSNSALDGGMSGVCGRSEGFLDYIRASRETRHALVISDPRPVESVGSMWLAVGQAANIGVFLLLFGAFLYIGRAILLPILAAAVVALTLAPLVKAAKRYGIPPWATALVIGVLVLGMLSAAAMLMSGPVSEWIARAPEIGATIKEKLSVLQRPLAALHDVQTNILGNGAASIEVNQPATNVVLPVMALVTPAVAQMLLFFGTLVFFLIGQEELRAHLVALFGDRESKLRFLKIMKDIEHNLTGFLTVVTIVNLAIGAIVAAGAWLIGFPNPIIFGVLAAVLNYVPYVGPAVMVVILSAVGLVTFSSLGHVLLAPACFVALTTMEGHFITPTIVGHRLTLNPLMVFLALAFWTWLWGPLGAFLAVPLSIIGLVIFNHLFPNDDVKLPE